MTERLIIFQVSAHVNRYSYHTCICRHGVRQFLTGWSDGPEFITQCPIRPGRSYTYKFTITAQEGTLWWHAHSSWLRATVYGALIILPRLGTTYPFKFTRPHRQIPILLGLMLQLFYPFYVPHIQIYSILLDFTLCPNNKIEISDAVCIHRRMVE